MLFDLAYTFRFFFFSHSFFPPSWYFARGTHPRTVLSTILSWFLPGQRSSESSTDSFLKTVFGFLDDFAIHLFYFNLNNE